MAFDKVICLELITHLCQYSTGTNISSVLTEAGMFAMRARRKIISESDLIVSIDKIIKGFF